MNGLGWRVLYYYCFPVWIIANWVRGLVRKALENTAKQVVDQNRDFLNYCKRAGISPYDHLEDFFSGPEQWLSEHDADSKGGKE